MNPCRILQVIFGLVYLTSMALQVSSSRTPQLIAEVDIGIPASSELMFENLNICHVIMLRTISRRAKLGLIRPTLVPDVK